ncbi:MAG: hypothetical protein H7838_10945, partial [Magnetococcus sp. DMHC-8]
MYHLPAYQELLLWIYSAAFFSMGLIIHTRVQTLPHSGWAGTFRWLAGFGFWHAIADAGELLILHDLNSPELLAAQAACEAVSWVFLLQFGLQLLRPRPGERSWPVPDGVARIALYGWVLLFIWYGSQEQWTEARVLSRYLLGVPATLLTALALLRPQAG